MMGDEVDEVYGVTKQQFHDYLECEDIGVAVVKFENGAVGTIEGTVNVYPKNLEDAIFKISGSWSIDIFATASTNTLIASLVGISSREVKSTCIFSSDI
jgi:hypothetical protein